MGNGIAHVFAQNNYQVSLVDINDESLLRGLQTIQKNLTRQSNKGLIDEGDISTILDRITSHTDLKSAVKNSDLVIEAATENEKVKLDIF